MRKQAIQIFLITGVTSIILMFAADYLFPQIVVSQGSVVAGVCGAIGAVISYLVVKPYKQ
jgi:hypothetical protein